MNMSTDNSLAASFDIGPHYSGPLSIGTSARMKMKVGTQLAADRVWLVIFMHYPTYAQGSSELRCARAYLCLGMACQP